jgi:hypothetical protein
MRVHAVRSIEPYSSLPLASHGPTGYLISTQRALLWEPCGFTGASLAVTLGPICPMDLVKGKHGTSTVCTAEVA